MALIVTVLTSVVLLSTSTIHCDAGAISFISRITGRGGNINKMTKTTNNNNKNDNDDNDYDYDYNTLHDDNNRYNNDNNNNNYDYNKQSAKQQQQEQHNKYNDEYNDSELQNGDNNDGYNYINHSINSMSSSESHDDSYDDITDDTSFQPLQVMCEVNGFVVPAIIDTGAQISIMSASCAKRCRISCNIDTRYAGRAVGVGSSDIIGRINGLEMRVGPVNFKNDISILREARVDFLIGMDFLKRFRCDVSFNDNVLRLQVREKRFRVPFVASNACNSIHDYNDFNNDYQNRDTSSGGSSSDSSSGSSSHQNGDSTNASPSTLSSNKMYEHNDNKSRKLDIYGEYDSDYDNGSYDNSVSMEGV